MHRLGWPKGCFRHTGARTAGHTSAEQRTPVHGTTLHCTGASGQSLQQEEHHRVHRIDILALLVHFSSYSWDGKLGVAFKVNLIRC